MSMPLQERSEALSILDKEILNCATDECSVGLLVVKIQRMRDVNVDLGYEHGEYILVEAEGRMQQVLRPCDYIIRIATYEYALILPKIKHKQVIVLAAKKVLQQLQKVVLINNIEVLPSSRIGIAVSPFDGAVSTELMRAADVALIKSKSDGEIYTVYSEDISQSRLSYLALERDLRSAIKTSGLEAYFQPKVDLKTGVVCGAEILSRWFSENHGVVSPERFISIAEESGLIHDLTKWSIARSMRLHSQLGKIKDHFMLSINISPVLLSESDIVYQITSAVNLWGINPVNVIVEITEGAIMADPDKSLQTLVKLHEAGIQISIDDFGTGYSSLEYLKRLPVNELKIDKSFVMRMTEDEDDTKIVQSVIGLGHNFDLVVTAEGVESEETLEKLKDLGCDYAQGFYIAKPMAEEDFIAWMKASHWPPK